MVHAFSKGVTTTVVVISLLTACGGGDGGGTPAAVSVPQCSGASCGPHGAPAASPLGDQAALCPADAEIGKSTYLGGAGSGEVVSVGIDATAMTYKLTWLESPVPLVTGTVTPTRAGTTITGQVAHPPTGTLPTAEQTRCAFVLLPGSGSNATANAAYSTSADFNPANPPMILVGFGVAGGGIPGATVQYDGRSVLRAVQQNPGVMQILSVLQNLDDLKSLSNLLQRLISPPPGDFIASIAQGLVLGSKQISLAQLQQVQQVLTDLQTPGVQKLVAGLAALNLPATMTEVPILNIPLQVGSITNRHIDFYPFLGFSNTTNDLSKLQGTYSGLMYHVVPSGGYAANGASTSETFDAGGYCVGSNPANSGYTPGQSGCLTTGSAWKPNASGYFDSAMAPQIGTQFSSVLDPALARGASDALGKIGPMLSLASFGAAFLDPNVPPIISKLSAGLSALTPLLQATSIPKAGTLASAHMVLGQLNGATIPLIVRTGFANPGTAALTYADAQVDDESGIAVLSGTTPLQPGGIDGNYAGADSNFKYTGAIIQGTKGTFVNPPTQQPEDSLTLDYSQTIPGLLKTATNNATAASGYLIAIGGLYATLITGPVNNGLSASSSALGSMSNINSAPAAPYFGIGALVTAQAAGGK
ncbi:DUF2957 domain-containing protein [Paraburkholderia xenovorans]|uniref:DUF2957 domain-containing protein n=1 Tax=Paraburkholderia xenovorans TaxID=36873 RepID=UPI0038B6C250